MMKPGQIRWPAPAKLNLFLHVNGRRPDGYHELQTLFIFLSHGDWLEFEVIPGSDQLTLSPAIPGVPDEQNLIIRAAHGQHLLQPDMGPLGARQPGLQQAGGADDEVLFIGHAGNGGAQGELVATR
ncbi:4-(cytidine 5'-diphospho)-2-C-methyl-D-erythritol kinase, partial [Aeromonas caviae]|nr:4-(cytidine 5'-diphospho)-2-C-methyl-D-erythritol kinase [Aeromonas caviae]